MIDHRTLEMFYWVARLGGFRRAAEKLNTTQPAISNRIAQIEARLGATLLDRNRRRVSLTPKGLLLLGYAERMLALQAETLAAMTDPASLHGAVRLGTSETIVHTWLSSLVGAVQEAYPHVSLDITVDDTGPLQAALLAGEIDVTLSLGPMAQPTVKDWPLCTYQIGWAARPGLLEAGRRHSLAELAAWPIITYGRTTLPHRDIAALFARAGVPARIFSASSVAAIARMAADGIGICAVAQTAIAEDVRSGRLSLLDAETPPAPLVFTASTIAGGGNTLADAVAALAQRVAAAG